MLTQIHAELGETVNVMRSNIEKMIRRGEKLEELEEKTEDLVNQSALFHSKSRKLKKQFWWKNAKFYIVGGVILVVVATIIVCKFISLFFSFLEILS